MVQLDGAALGDRLERVDRARRVRLHPVEGRRQLVGGGAHRGGVGLAALGGVGDGAEAPRRERGRTRRKVLRKPTEAVGFAADGVVVARRDERGQPEVVGLGPEAPEALRGDLVRRRRPPRGTTAALRATAARRCR